MKLVEMGRGLWRGRDGGFAILSGFLIVPLLLAAGSALDYLTALNRKVEIQTAADTAVLSAATVYASTATAATLQKQVDGYLVSEAGLGVKRTSGPTLSQDGKQICIRAGEDVPTAVMQIVAIKTVPVSVIACATLPIQMDVEVSLVLDVSSSMIEQKRFAPMQQAVQSFLKGLAPGGSLPARTKVAMVPFSSRVSFGMTRPSWLRAYDGNPAVPTRWSNPQSVYSPSKYSFDQWLDGTTTVASNSSNVYWMGCIEPRADVEVKDSGSFSAASLGDDPPSAKAFVPMDSNPFSAKSFCPPPITPLTNDLKTLQAAIAQTTSEGSTRLDMGMVAGWYTLSPKWRSAWGSGAPLDYGKTVKKYVVFMTDGQMNTKHDPGSDPKKDKLDWICSKDRTDGCDDTAVGALLQTCKGMKAAGIEIYAVSYGEDADIDNLKSCASGADHFYMASTSSIKSVYDAISRNIGGSNVRLTQ